MIASSLLLADGLYTTYVYADGGQEFHGISVNVDPGGYPGNNYDNDGAGYLGIAIGNRASSERYGTAVGPFAKAGALSNATGYYAQALGEYSAAYGAGAKAINALGVAFGQGAVVSFGKPLSEADYNMLPEPYKKLFTAVRTEEAKTVYYQTKILLQDGSTQDQKIFSVAIGASAAATDNNAVAIGYKSSADEMGAIGIGAFTEAKGKQGLALGYVAKAIGDFSTAVGQWSQANGDHAVAIGYGAITEKNQAGVAIGYESHSMRIGGKGWNPVTDQVWDDSEAQIEALGLKEKVQALDEEIAQKQALEQQAKEELAKAPHDPDLIEKARVAHNEKAKADEKKNKLFATWKTPTGDVAVGNSDTGMTRQITGVAAGSEDTDAVNVAQLKVLNTKVDKVAANSTAYTVETKENDDNTTTVTIKSNKAGDTGTTVTVATKDIHITSGTYDKNTKKLTFTTNTNTTFDVDMNDVINAAAAGGVHYLSVNSSETGEGSNYKNDGATGEDAVAIGSKTKAQGDYSTALGNGAQAQGSFSTAVGRGSQAQSWFSTALGYGAQAKEESSTALGQGAQALEDGSVALGEGTVAGRKAGTVGYLPSADGNLDDVLTALGKKADYDTLTETIKESKKEYDNLTKAFENASTEDEKTEAKDALDKWKREHQDFLDALEAKSKLEATWRATKAAVSVGRDSLDEAENRIIESRQITNVAAGSEDTDAVNVAQLKALNKKVDGKKDIHFFSSNGSGSDINYDNQGARAGFTTAVGPDAMATEENSQAFGYRARAIGHSSIVFGVESTASGARDIAIGYGSHAVGSDNTNTSWNDTIAIGWNALSRGGSFASGTGAVAGGSGSVALGGDAYVGTKWLDDKTQKEQNVNKWVLTSYILDDGLKKELKEKFPEKFAEWERRAKNMPDAMGSEYLEQKLRTLAMEQLPQMTSPSMKNTMKDMESSIAIGRRTKVYSASAVAIGSEAKVGENLDGAIALGNQSLATRNAGSFGYDPTSDATTWTDFKKAHPEAGISAAREQEIKREMNDISNEVEQMGPTYQAWIDKEKYPDNYLDERKAYAESHGNTLHGNNEWVEWIVHVRNEKKKVWDKGQELTNKYNNLQKELNGGGNLGKGAWIGNKAALAIGNEEAGVTRQITGVAAGTKDTDAVNVAQLKVLNTKVDKVAANSTAYTVETKENNDNTTTVTIKSNKAGDKGTTVTVATKDIHITSGTYDKNTKKLTFTTNTNTTFDVDMNDVINAAATGGVHYLSVNSSETGEGSNYKNDGAKAKGSIVLGVRSSSEGINGVVVGNDNKLTGTKNDQNNSVVIGTGLNVDGVHNIVVGTNYENYDQKETKVKGEQNTVIGNGNLVGYTAVKDPHDATKWKYTEVSTSGSDRNVVVGSCNTANVSSVAVGTSLEVEDLGRAFGSGNKIIGSNNGGGQWGLALGSNNTVKGEKAVSVGTDTNASGDWTVAIGAEAKTNETNSIAMGYQAETVKAWSTAIGSNAKTEGTASTAVGGFGTSATVDYGAAFGSFSVAQRASGEVGYLANGQKSMAWQSNLGAFSVGDDVKGYSRQITGVAAGTNDTDAVNVAQLKAIENKIGTGGTNGKDGKSAYDIWLETQTDKTKTKQDFLDSLKGKDGKDGIGANIDIKDDTKSGVSVKSTTDDAGNKTYTIGLGTKINAGAVTIDGTKDKENIAVGDVKIHGEKGKGTITGLSNTKWDGQRIVSGRAATEDQLQQATATIQHHMVQMGQRVDRVGAKSAALAALHPLDYDADDKWDFSVAVGNYNGANSAALGAFYRPNERTMISMGGTIGGEDNMVNLGVSFKTGSGVDGQVYTSRAAMAKEIKALKEKDAQREEQVRQLIALVTAMQQK